MCLNFFFSEKLIELIERIFDICQRKAFFLVEIQLRVLRTG